ncbi:hypothetical protein QQF64_027223 [Cirrhinus molitorella]|uniref:Uncharacterized protein n=1 Tax=Cirrhinus molitorella TaxID=172907 RepID=A0ABR3NBU1_9TELE
MLGLFCKEVKLRKLEIEAAKAASVPTVQRSSLSVSDNSANSGPTAFDVGKHIALCKLVGKALEVYSTLSLEDSLKYDIKLAILRAYELVPEAYRQQLTVTSEYRDVPSDPTYLPFLFKGFVSLTGRREDQVEVQVLHDTGTAQSFVCADVLLFSDQSSVGANGAFEEVAETGDINEGRELVVNDLLPLVITREKLMEAQNNDSSLAKCFKLAEKDESVGVVGGVSPATEQEDADLVGFLESDIPRLSARLSNSETLANLSKVLGHLSDDQRQDVVDLFNKFPSNLGDAPTLTNVLQHDIIVNRLFTKLA